MEEKELRPLDDIFSERKHLFSIYADLVDCDKNKLQYLRKDFEALMRYDLMYMPLWLVIELQDLGFDVGKRIVYDYE